MVRNPPDVTERPGQLVQILKKKVTGRLERQKMLWKQGVSCRHEVALAGRRVRQHKIEEVLGSFTPLSLD